MKILIATGIYPPSIGGPATYSRFLEEEFPKLGITTTVITFDSVRKYPKIIRHIVYFWLVLKSARHVDRIYALDPVSVGLPALFVSKIFRKAFFVKVVGDYAWEQGVQRYGVKELLDDFIKNKDKQPIGVKFLSAIESFVAQRAKKIIVPSKYLKKIVRSWGVVPENIVVIPNAFEGLENIHSVNKIHISGRTIVSAGRLVPWKGFLVLVDAVYDLLKKFPDLKLFIIGDGPDREAIKHRIKNLELERNVFLTGSVSKEILFDYLKQASLFVLNTGYEGFSHQILEALGSGVPTVTTNVGGNPEIIENGENGLLVPHNDKNAIMYAIEKMLLDDNFRQSCVREGKVTVSKFTKEATLEPLIRIFEETT